MATTTDDTALGRWLKRRRKSLSLTQHALAERVGCAPSMLQKIEQGTRRPSGDLAERLVDTVGVTPQERAQVLRFARGSRPEVPAEIAGDTDPGEVAPSEQALARTPTVPILLTKYWRRRCFAKLSCAHV
jgi:transcriptional regulator with XRE-family HTH domain